MANLNLRGISDELAHSLRVEAAEAEMGVRDYCVSILEARGELELVGAEVERGIVRREYRSEKKIAGVSAGVAQAGGGPPEEALPPVGKAQDTRIGVNYPPHDPPVVLLEKSNKFPEWSEARLREMAEEEDEALSATGGLLACSPELYAEMGKTVRQKFADGVSCGHAGCLSHVSHPCEGCGRVGGYRRQDGGIGDEIDYADQEQYLDMKRSVKNQLEGIDAVEGAGEAGQDGRGSGRGVEAATGGSDGAEGSAVGVGSAKIDLQALKEICAGKIPNNIYCECGDEMCLRCNKCKGCEGCECSDPAEIEICGFKSFNDEDGEWYMCCKEKHPYPKIKHGEWVKV